MLAPLITASTVPIVVKPFANISPRPPALPRWQTAYPCHQKTLHIVHCFAQVMLAEELNKHRTVKLSNITTTRCSSDCISPTGQGTASRASGLTASPVKWRIERRDIIESFLLCLFVIDIFSFLSKARCTKKWEIATEIMTKRRPEAGSGRSKWQFSFLRLGSKNGVRFQNPPLNGHGGCITATAERRLTPRLTSVGNKVPSATYPDRRRW